MTRHMKNIRRQLLIHPNFQLRFALYVTAAIFVISLAFPVFFFSVFSHAEQNILVSNNPAALQAFQEAQKDSFWIYISCQLLLLVIGFGISLTLSHRIAGPLYKLKTAMIALQQGVLDRHITFRKRDNFQELASTFNSMSDALFIRRRRDYERVLSVIPKLERVHNQLHGEEKAIVHEALSALQEIHREITPR